jgi:hypothetical protein
MISQRWFDNFENILILGGYLAEDMEYTAEQVIAACKTPWRYEREFVLAVQQMLGGEEDYEIE